MARRSPPLFGSRPSSSPKGWEAGPARIANGFWQAVVLIVVADFTLSLENVLALAAASRGYLLPLAPGLDLSVLIWMRRAGLAPRWPNPWTRVTLLMNWAGPRLCMYKPLPRDWTNGRTSGFLPGRTLFLCNPRPAVLGRDVWVRKVARKTGFGDYNERVRFKDRRHAAELLAEAVRPLGLVSPVVLGIPRGGVVIADVLAEHLGGTMDVILARKVGAPGNPEFALGAVAETGEVILQPYAYRYADEAYIRNEVARQLLVIEERRAKYRAARLKEPLAGQMVVLTDDGMATGSTMEAALAAVQAEAPARVVVAVPVAPPEAVTRLRGKVEVVVLSTPPDFTAVAAYYEVFPQVEDDEVVALLAKWGGKV